MTYLLLFLGTLIEADAALVAAAFLAHRGRLSLAIVIPVCIAATFTANQFWFWLARLRGRAYLERKLQSDRRFQRIHGWLKRRGTVLVPGSRFLYGFRAAIPAVYGASGMSPLTFTWLDAASALIWGVVVGFAGYAFGGTLEALLPTLRRYEVAVVVGLLAIGAAAALRRQRRLLVVAKALRGPVDAGGESVVALLLLARQASRLLVVHPHGRLAAFAVALGLLNMVSAIARTRFLHLEWLTTWLPFEVVTGSRVLMLLAGVGLAYLGRGLARRKRTAWAFTLALAVLSSLLFLGHHGSVVRALLSAWFAVELWRHRQRFRARTDPLRLRHALLATPVLGLAVSAYGLAGLHETGYRPSGVLDGLRTTWLVAGFQESPALGDTPGAETIIWSLRLLFVLSTGYVLTAALAPVAWRDYRTRLESVRVAGLAWQHGHDSMSYFAKQDDKRHFSIDGRAFAGFRVKNRVAIVAGDPIGEENAIPLLIERFVALCASNDWIPVFYETSERYLEDYRRNGLRWFKIGEEAVLPLPTWSLSGAAVAKVRQFMNKVHREAPDLVVIEYRRHSPEPEIDDQLEEISSEWLAGKHGGEMGFNLGVFSVEDLGDKRTILAQRADGNVEAFVTWLPYSGGRAVLLDAMRHRRDAQAGVMDLLIAESALQFKKEGLQALSLAMAPLANVDEASALSPYDRGVRLLFDHFSAVYGYRTLFQYKKKFAPDWHPRFLVFPRPDQLVRIAYALVSVHYSAR